MADDVLHFMKGPLKMSFPIGNFGIAAFSQALTEARKDPSVVRAEWWGSAAVVCITVRSEDKWYVLPFDVQILDGRISLVHSREFESPVVYRDESGQFSPEEGEQVTWHDAKMNSEEVRRISIIINKHNGTWDGSFYDNVRKIAEAFPAD